MSQIEIYVLQPAGMAKPITQAKLLELHSRMVREAFHRKHTDPQGIAAEYVARLLEGYHQKATVAQAYIDICRLTLGRKGQPGYLAKKRLNMLAVSDAQNQAAEFQPQETNLTPDQWIDLKRALGLIKSKRTQDMFHKVIQGWTYEAIADEYGLTLTRVQQIVSREIVSIRAQLER